MHLWFLWSSVHADSVRDQGWPVDGRCWSSCAQHDPFFRLRSSPTHQSWNMSRTSLSSFVLSRSWGSFGAKRSCYLVSIDFIWLQHSLIKFDCLIQFILLGQCWIEVDGGTRSKNMEAYEVVGISVLALACYHVLVFKKNNGTILCFLRVFARCRVQINWDWRGT